LTKEFHGIHLSEGKRLIASLFFNRGCLMTNPTDLAEVELNTASDGAPSEQEIAIRAHELFLERVAVEGHDLED
jgi:hypothetical protein